MSVIRGTDKKYIDHPEVLLNDIMEGGSKSSYFDYVKEYQAAHPNMTWMKAVKKAKSSYRKSHPSAKKHKGRGMMKALPPRSLSAVEAMPYGGIYAAGSDSDSDYALPKAGRKKKSVKKAGLEAGSWFLDHEGHKKAAKKGWEKKGKGLSATGKKKKGCGEMAGGGSFLDQIPIVGPIASIFGLGAPMDKRKVAKQLKQEHMLMKEAMSSGGLSAGSKRRAHRRMKKIEKMFM